MYERNQPHPTAMSIYAASNPFDYKYNVNHPWINDLYRRYKKWKGISQSSPMTKAQRFEFERYIDELIAGQKNH